MIPIRDIASPKGVPIVTYLIIALNVLIYIIQPSGGDSLFFVHYGLVPALWTNPEFSVYFSKGERLFSLISFMFIHGGFFHLIGNMWSLYIFGDNVEYRLGSFRYLVFYLVCGIMSGLSHFMFNLDSTVPAIGASGAIAGVMGAYIVLYPNAKILTFIPILFIPWFIKIPAFVFLGIWFIFQFINAASAGGGAGGVAWWAHVGGFIFGIFFLKMFLKMPEEKQEPFYRMQRKKTEKLQVIRPVGLRSEDPNLYGVVKITQFEADNGTLKIVDIPWGFHSRLIRLTIAPGTKQGDKLRLQGLGKIIDQNIRGDLFLKVEIT